MDNNNSELEKICRWCKKPKSQDQDWNKHQSYIQDVINAFSYHIGGQEVTEEEYNRIVKKQGYVTQEQTDSIKEKNKSWKRFLPGIKRPF